MKLEIEQIDGFFLVTDNDKCTRHIYTLTKLMEMLIELGQVKSRSMTQMLNERWARTQKIQQGMNLQAQARYNTQAQAQAYNAYNDIDQTRGF